ncbi:MAG: YqcC family protein [Bacteroidetes bacterium]|nr:YqcC family protein [Bacteroidota bacterium]
MDIQLYVNVLAKANEIETELKRLNRWSDQPLPEEKFENMGAFGAGAMSFEQWIQFVLIDTIREIVKEQAQFPDESNVGVYAVREFDGDAEASTLIKLLCELDELINLPFSNSTANSNSISDNDFISTMPGEHELGSVNDLPFPPVVYHLAEILSSYEGEGLESQLQTFDAFLANTNEEGRSIIAQLLFEASDRTTSAKERLRIRKAAISVAGGERAAAPYNHEEAMKKYQEEFRKNFPDQSQ